MTDPCTQESTRLLRIHALSRSVWTLGRPEREVIPISSGARIALMAASGAIYGAVMGSFDLSEAQRAWLMVFGAIKVPLLIAATTLVCLPAYFVLNTVLGLRRDFQAAIRAVMAAQAAMTVALASLAPVTRFVYCTAIDHREAVLFNAGMFAVATMTAQVVLLRRYRPLIARAPRHRAMLWMWVVMYAFVGIQTGWMLRPFVGTPGNAVAFLRDEPFGNAYVAVARIFAGLGK